MHNDFVRDAINGMFRILDEASPVDVPRREAESQMNQEERVRSADPSFSVLKDFCP